MSKEHTHQLQMSLLSPEDAENLHLFRHFVGEVAALYESRRLSPTLEEPLTINRASEAYQFFRLEMEDLEQEQLRTIQLDIQNHVLSARMIYQGSMNRMSVRLAEIFRPAIVDNAAAIILCHNHPSGDASPSAEDIQATQAIIEAGKLLDIEVLDHIVMGKGKYVSLHEQGVAGFSNYASLQV